MPIVFEHITRSPEERALRARLFGKGRALQAEAESVARQAAAGGERRRVVVATSGDDSGHGRGRARVVAPPPAERPHRADAPSPFRPLRPGDRIVKPPSLTTPMPTSTTPTTAPLTPGPASPRIEPVAAILDRRQTAVARMAAWYRGDPGARPSAAAPVASAPAGHATQPAAPLPVAEIFARRQRTIAAARPWATKES